MYKGPGGSQKGGCTPPDRQQLRGAVKSVAATTVCSATLDPARGPNVFEVLIFCSKSHSAFQPALSFRLFWTPHECTAVWVVMDPSSRPRSAPTCTQISHLPLCSAGGARTLIRFSSQGLRRRLAISPRRTLGRALMTGPSNAPKILVCTHVYVCESPSAWERV
jgi:hypothetical protein